MDNNYQLGKLTGSLDALKESVDMLAKDVERLNRRLDDLEFFKSKVLGMAIGASAVVSLTATVLAKAYEAWAK